MTRVDAFAESFLAPVASNCVGKYLLDTPTTLWFTPCGYHIHKSVWGILMVVSGSVFVATRVRTASIILLSVGGFVLLIAYLGQLNNQTPPRKWCALSFIERVTPRTHEVLGA
jgi:hypothetical protein